MKHELQVSEDEAREIAMRLLATYQCRAFEIAMPDKESYDLMRSSVEDLGRQTELSRGGFVLKVLGVVA